MDTDTSLFAMVCYYISLLSQRAFTYCGSHYFWTEGDQVFILHCAQSFQVYPQKCLEQLLPCINGAIEQ